MTEAQYFHQPKIHELVTVKNKWVCDKWNKNKPKTNIDDIEKKEK